MADLSMLTATELAEGICLRSGQIAAAQAELLLWIGEFDRREAWAGPGLLSCAHWLSWRTGLSLNAGREQVRVARRLSDLPELAAAFADGRISYSKMRAITRVADPDDGVDWVALARHSSAAQLEKIVRGVRRAHANQAAEADPEKATWQLRTRIRYDDNGNFTCTISGPPEYLPVVQAGVAAKRAELDRQRDAALETSAETPAALETSAGTWEGAETSAETPAALETSAETWEGAEASAETTAAPAVSDADALLALAQDALAAEQQAHPDTARRRRPQLTAQVDPLSGWARLNNGKLLPPTNLRTVLRTLPGRDGVLRLRPLTTADLHRHDLGRTSRDASPALRELLGTLDGERCRFPGRTRHRNLHAHHVRHWSDGGRTDLDNLVLVCARHHTLIHSQGFHLVLHPDRRLEVTTADGTALLHHPAHPWGDPAALTTRTGISAETLPPDHCDSRLDLGHIVHVLLTQAA